MRNRLGCTLNNKIKSPTISVGLNSMRSKPHFELIIYAHLRKVQHFNNTFLNFMPFF